MQIIRQLSGLRGALRLWREAGETIALVPTMGALHAGHVALIEEARRRAERVVATIFVNPLQFNDPADLERYPRQESEDEAILDAAGCDLLWMPGVADLYPDGFATTVSVAGVSEAWEGAHRPGHFDGVATVVAKLFAGVGPDVALFGEKDWQQLSVIRRMATDLGFPVEIVGVETVRESDGLAKSSRNALLSADQRDKAAGLYWLLVDAAGAIGRGAVVRSALKVAIDNIGKNGFGPIDYVAYVDGDTLEPLGSYRDGGRLIAAAFLGTTRLIDNIRVVSDTVAR